MLKRWGIYFKEMYPLIPRMLLGYMLFFEIYFLILLTNGKAEFTIGISEFVGGITVFGFLLLLRIADDFKDYKADLKLFPNRPLPSGRVTKKDLTILLVIDVAALLVLNIVFMNNIFYFLFLMLYGTLMSLWFFSRKIIQKSLPLALVTHNPIQLIINLYIISFTCIKYGVPLISYANILVLFSLYFDGLVWEIGRKIKAPGEETEYTTYSKIFGYKKPVYFIIAVMLVDLVTSSLMVMELFKPAVIGTVIGYVLFFLGCRRFLKNPVKFKMQPLMEKYLYVTELYIVILIVSYLVFRV